MYGCPKSYWWKTGLWRWLCRCWMLVVLVVLAYSLWSAWLECLPLESRWRPGRCLRLWLTCLAPLPLLVAWIIDRSYKKKKKKKKGYLVPVLTKMYDKKLTYCPREHHEVWKRQNVHREEGRYRWYGGIIGKGFFFVFWHWFVAVVRTNVLDGWLHTWSSWRGDLDDLTTFRC